ncbi:hypothetical protein, partial [Allochromatium palmeri]|uniref:hypothetical protein n=1 Tax=Allochromatium palmeri TaxID=231048 RepID=UPI001CA389BE
SFFFSFVGFYPIISVSLLLLVFSLLILVFFVLIPSKAGLNANDNFAMERSEDPGLNPLKSGSQCEPFAIL